jgi:hypothetical protein
MSTETEPLKKAISESKLAACRANSKKSTGPRTAEGKAVSRCNALKHGLYAETVPIPGENGELFDSRFGAWSRELNPLGTEAGDYIVAQLVRKSIRLDRCHQVYDATTADLARAALHVRAEGRTREVEELSRRIEVDNDIAVRRLREIPEGCDYLIQEWEQFVPTLLEPTLWDDDDETNATKLEGRLRSKLGKAPAHLVGATMAMVEHRRVAKKLKDNENPDSLDWTQTYKSASSHQVDRDNIHDLELVAIKSKAEIETTVAEAIAELRSRKIEVEDRERVEKSEASQRARFDDTDRGKLLHRHESDLERGFFRGLKEARELTRWTMQMEATNVIAPDRSWAGTRPPAVNPARNEATAGSSRGGLAGWEPVEIKGYSEVDVSITPKIGPKRRQ